jgi:hypothetical protein
MNKVRRISTSGGSTPRQAWVEKEGLPAGGSWPRTGTWTYVKGQTIW